MYILERCKGRVSDHYIDRASIHESRTLAVVCGEVMRYEVWWLSYIRTSVAHMYIAYTYFQR